jgi:hypothetical protein
MTFISADRQVGAINSDRRHDAPSLRKRNNYQRANPALLHLGSLVGYPTISGGTGQVMKVQKDPYWNNQNKTFRIYFTQSMG